MQWSLLVLLPALALPAPLPGLGDAAPIVIAEDPIEVSIDWLTSLEYKPGMKLPQELLALNGKEIRLTGYMAIGTLEGVRTFELVPESCECGRSKVQHFIEVTLGEGSVTFQPGRISLTGIFDVGEVLEDGFVVSLYRLKDAKLELALR